MNRCVDIMRTSASRPLFLRVTTESWRERLRFSGDLRWIVHEDYLDALASEECVKYARGAGYDVVLEDKDPVGQSSSLTKLWDVTETDYVLNVEDDYHLLEDVDLDRLCRLMDDHLDVNQIAFFKRPLMAERQTYVKRSRQLDGVWLTSGPHWAFTPALCRRKWIASRWRDTGGAIHHVLNHEMKANAPMPLTAAWTDEHLGTYMMGRVGKYPPGDPRTGLYVQHLGTERWSKRAPVESALSVGGKIRYQYEHPNLYYGDMFLRPGER